MQRIFFRALLGSALAAGLSLNPTHASQPVPIKDLARQPALQSITMSPDGKYLVGLIPSPTNPKQTALATWNTGDLSSGPKVVTPSGKEGHMQFIAAVALKAGKILAVTRQEWTGQLGGCGEGKIVGATRTYVSKAYLTGMQQKDFNIAFASERHKVGVSENTRRCLQISGTASLVSMLPMSPDKVIIRRVSALNPVGSYYLFNLKTQKTKLLFRGSPGFSPSLFDPHTGKLLVKTQLIPVNHDYKLETLIQNPGTGKFEVQAPLTNDLSKRHSVHVIGIDDTTGKYYVLTDQFSDKVQLWMYDATTQKYDPKPALANKNFSIVGLVFGTSPANFNQVVGFTVGGPYLKTIYIAPKLKGIQAALEKAFPGQQIHISSYTNDFSKVLFTTISAQSPAAYHLLENGKNIVNLGSKRPWIKKGMTGQERWVTYKARDGMTIPAILDLPAGWKKGDAPTKAVVMPHGGPWSRDHMGWGPAGWIAMLTSRGYAVLRPEYRGSSGLGRKLWLAGDSQWGLKMSDDLDDGAAWLIKQGIAAKNRIAIFGYSYGGFAAVAADVRSPSPFQCAIAGAPVADLGQLNVTWSSNPLQRILQGQTVKGMDPMQNTGKAHLPIMLFAGDRDVRVPEKDHAHAFYEAVKSTVPAQFHLIPDMPHSLPWYPRQRSKVMHVILNYLTKNCGPSGI